MPTLPLVAHASLEAPLAYRDGKPISVRQFLADMHQVTGLLPPGQHVLNLCGDRYHFTVTLAAAIVSGRTSLLPSTYTPETVRQMQAIASDVFAVNDQDSLEVALTTIRYPLEPAAADTAEVAIPAIDVDQIVAQVFTSGSTGLPLPHPKRWGSLVRNVQGEAVRLGVKPGHSLVATVPPQHMYGLESSVLMPLQSGATFEAGRPFFPADIVAAIDALPRPRLLITTPYHLRILLADITALPALDLILSATAPLTQSLAREAETRFAAPLHEIYGCTETGQIASRRTTIGAEWQPLPGVRLRADESGTWAEGGHIDAPTRLGDVIELTAGDGFLLHGRHADLVNIAGKRTSLSYLNHQLNAIPGVQDGVFLLPESETEDGVSRLSAMVVAPGLSPASLLSALRERIDAVFLPRPLLFVDALPRNTTGKLPSQLAQDLLASLRDGAHADQNTPA